MKFPYKILKTEEFASWQQQYTQVLQSNSAVTAFSKEIEQGKLSATFQHTGQAPDELTQALLSMQQQFQRITLQEKERNWTTHGIALFADILRSDTTDSEVLYQKIISSLVKYLNANQGGLFFLNSHNEENTIIVLACFTPFQPYQMEFLEKAGANIASTVKNVKSTEKTKKLLQDTLQQAEELKAQEEEMRQNMEELYATQENQHRLHEELRASEEELKKHVTALVEAREETERVWQIEQARANEQIEAWLKSAR